MEYTKGKWHVGNETTTYPISIVILCTIDDGINEPFDLEICEVLPKIGDDKKGNAKLISKAPEMYEALKQIDRDFEDGSKHDMEENTYHIWQNIKSILKELE